MQKSVDKAGVICYISKAPFGGTLAGRRGTGVPALEKRGLTNASKGGKVQKFERAGSGWMRVNGSEEG